MKSEPKYKVVDGTFYYEETPDEVIVIIEQCRKEDIRVKLSLGNRLTGEDWNEEYHVTGTIGRSIGPTKIPILIHNARSTGGGAILTHCIVKIVTSKGKKQLYIHPKYHTNESN